MNLQQAGWTPDNLEEAEMADANKGAKRPAARTPGSKDREPQPASQERLPPRGRKARKGLDDDLGRAANQEEADSKQQQLYNTTVLAEDEFHLVYLEIFPSKLETNPPAKYMCFTSASRITYEIRIKAIAHGVDPSKFLRYGAAEVKGKRGHYLMVVDDEADGYEIVKAIQGLVRCVPDVPKDNTKRFDNFEYEYVVRVHDESEGGRATESRRAPRRNTSEELSVSVKLSCGFHFQFDKTHLALPWEQSGWQVTHVHFPRVKVEGSTTADRAPVAIIKVRPPGHIKNELAPGGLTMEEAGRNAPLPRYLHLEIPFENQPTKVLDAVYFVYDKQSNPPCDLQKCFACHRPRQFGCAFDCELRMVERRQENLEAQRRAKEFKARYEQMAERAGNAAPDKVCEDFKWGLCTTLIRKETDRCAKGRHEGKPGPCNLGPPKGALREHYAGMTPPWPFCKQGPTCTYDHTDWSYTNMKDTIKKRLESEGQSSNMETERCPIKLISCNCIHYLKHQFVPLQVDASGSRMRNAARTEGEPRRRRGHTPPHRVSNKYGPSKRRGSDRTAQNRVRLMIATKGESCRRRGHSHIPQTTRLYVPGRRRGSGMTETAHSISRVYTKTIPKQENTQEMCRRRHIRLGFGMWHIQRRKGTTVPARRDVCVHTESSTTAPIVGEETIFTGLRFGVRRNSPKAGGMMRKQEGDQNEEVKTYYRGGARDQMAKASRRLTAGERAMSHNKKRKMRRGGKIKNVGCTEGFTPRIEYHAQNKEKILSRAVVTLGSLHDQRRQWGGEWREGGALQGGRYTHTKQGWYSM